MLAQRCAMTSLGEFWLQCEGIVQELDDRRQELPMGILKQLHTRMMFILTRGTRLLQFHKESGLDEDELVLQLRPSLHSADKRIPPRPSKPPSSSSSRKSFSQEQHGMLEPKKEKPILQHPANVASLPTVEIPKNLDSGRDRMASWKKFPSPGPGPKSPQEEVVVKEQTNIKLDAIIERVASEKDVDPITTTMKPLPVKDSHAQSQSQS
uniref:IREH1/IRE-like N-terminal domain-containing protein n=1 Tax=Lactuca sativa TaxID=4236 RepID=A0A9R1VFC8_LACSA|nr:hypothetical protein LSAT_V11C500283680 [Lactuca sativa]